MRRSIILIGIFLLILFAGAGWLHLHVSRYNFQISQAAARNGLDFYLVKALVYEESWFRSEIRGPAGEWGLMQITSAAASDFAASKGLPPFHDERLIEPELNLEIGCWYLRRSIDHYRATIHPTLFALFRYNAGESRADNWLRLAMSTPPPAGVSQEDHCLSVVSFPKTRAYASRILKRYRSRNFWF
jgi:soluble lytic murein transglycosylase